MVKCWSLNHVNIFKCASMTEKLIKKKSRRSAGKVTKSRVVVIHRPFFIKRVHHRPQMVMKSNDAFTIVIAFLSNGEHKIKQQSCLLCAVTKRKKNRLADPWENCDTCERVVVHYSDDRIEMGINLDKWVTRIRIVSVLNAFIISFYFGILYIVHRIIVFTSK